MRPVFFPAGIGVGTQERVLESSHASIPHRRFDAFDLVAPDGSRFTVNGADDSTTVRDLLRAGGGVGVLPNDTALAIDGRSTTGDELLVHSGLRHGSRLTVGGTQPTTRRPRVRVTWIAGPDAGATFDLDAGVHIIGRASTAAVRCRDPELEMHHASLYIGDDATMSVTQLAGSGQVCVDGAPIDTGRMIGVGQWLQLGASVLEVGALAQDPPVATTTGTGIGNPWRRLHVRTPRPLPGFEPTPLDVPERRTSDLSNSGGLLPAVIGVVGAGVMALVLHQVMFLLFGLMGAAVASGTWIAHRVSTVRARGRSRREYERESQQFVAAMFAQQAQARAAHLAMTPTIAQALADLRHQHAALWSVRPTHPDAFFVSIGFGEQSWTPQFRKADHISDDLRSVIERARHLDRVPVPMVLESGTFTAVVGDVAVAAATVRSMVIQLAASSGPADWQLAVITDNDDEWRCLSWLAHLTDNAGAPRIVQSNNVADFTASVDMNDHRLLVLVVDRAEVFAARTSAVRRLIAGTRPVAVLLCCASARDVPALATRMLKLGPHSIGSWTADTRSQSAPLSVHVAGLSRVNAHDAAAAAAHLIDPEIEGESTAIPQAVSLMDLLGVDDYDSDAIAACLVAQWQGVGRQPAPCTPIGVAADGMVEIDLAADGPHALLAGTTGAGKSELLRSMVIGLATRLRPDEINFVLIDYKGGATFDACVDLPHVVGLVTDLDDRLGSRALRSMDAELRRREGLLRDAGASDLDTFRSMAARSSARPASLPVLPRLVVVIDEFATLAVQQPEFIGALLGIAQRGRSLGVHLVLATQRPGGVISDDIRANTNLRIALRVQDAADSNDVIGDPGAAMLPRGRAGRAILRLANDELIPFQTARSTGPVRDNARDGALWVQRTPDRTAQSCEGDVAKPAHLDESSELAVMARAVGIATRLASIAQPYRPWLPPLETVIERTTIDPRAVGVLDDPDRQRRVPLTWHRGDGHLLIVGASGMGATSALLSLATLTHVAEPDSELFIIDAMGDARLKALDLGPGCATVVGVHERERLTRLLALVDAERLSRKSGCAAAPGGIMLMIDGIGALRAELEAHDCFDQLAQLDAILTDGQSVDISVAVTATQPGAVPSHLLSLIAQRWMLHLADPFDASMLGVPFSLMPEAVPGRMLDVRTRLEGQLAIFEASSATLIASAQPSRRASRPLRSLPTSVDVGELPQSSRRGDDVALAVGLTYAHVEPSMLTIPSGEHVLVVGPYRSGRTSALRTIARGWAEVHSEGWIGCVAPRRSSIRQGRAFAKVCELAQELPPDGDALIIVDDAELVDDPSGVLASLTSSRRDGLTVVAAARPEALRASYGHWTGAVRRSRLGLVMAACADIDGDLLNVVVPRRLPVAARPGLAWLVADGGSQLVQLARETGRDFAGADRVIT